MAMLIELTVKSAIATACEKRTLRIRTARSLRRALAAM
jgi:hypothetical protein